MALIVALSIAAGTVISCGSSLYRMSVHGEEPEPELTNNLGNTNLYGVHSAKGWKNKLPIKFYTAEDMPVELVEQVQNAMNTWEAAVGLDLFSYEGLDDVAADNMSELYNTLKDDKNGHYLDLQWVKNTEKSRLVLATTVWENSPEAPDSIAKADIRYNAESYKFGDSLEEASADRRIMVDMETLALHELGHLLGLTHVSVDDDPFSVMNPSLFIGEGLASRNLSTGDVERIRSIYGVGDDSQADTLVMAEDVSVEELESENFE